MASISRSPLLPPLSFLVPSETEKDVGVGTKGNERFAELISRQKLLPDVTSNPALSSFGDVGHANGFIDQVLTFLGARYGFWIEGSFHLSPWLFIVPQS